MFDFTAFVNAFVLASTEVFYFGCKNEKLRQEWVTELQNVIHALEDSFITTSPDDGALQNVSEFLIGCQFNIFY